MRTISIYLDEEIIPKYHIETLKNLPLKFGKINFRSDTTPELLLKVDYAEAILFIKKACDFYDKDDRPSIYFRDAIVKISKNKGEYIELNGFITGKDNEIFIFSPTVHTFLHELAHYLDEYYGHTHSFWRVFDELVWLWSIKEEL